MEHSSAMGLTPEQDLRASYQLLGIDPDAQATSLRAMRSLMHIEDEEPLVRIVWIILDSAFLALAFRLDAAMSLPMIMTFASRAQAEAFAVTVSPTLKVYALWRQDVMQTAVTSNAAIAAVGTDGIRLPPPSATFLVDGPDDPTRRERNGPDAPTRRTRGSPRSRRRR